jgi:hypothetical protein
MQFGSVEGARRESMKRLGWASLVIVALLIATVAPTEAGGRHHRHGGTRVFVGLGFGPAWYGYPYYPYYPYWYYPPPVYAYPAPVVVQQPTVYVEQAPVPPTNSAPPTPQQYWYYCESAGTYYPNVQNCVEPWVKVPARAQN